MSQWQYYVGFGILAVILGVPLLALVMPGVVERQERKNPKQAAYMREVDDELTAKGL